MRDSTTLLATSPIIGAGIGLVLLLEPAARTAGTFPACLAAAILAATLYTRKTPTDA